MSDRYVFNSQGRDRDDRKKAEMTRRMEQARGSRMSSWQASIERREKRRAEEEEARRAAAEAAQREAAQARRDKQQQSYDQTNMGQRSIIAANAAAGDFKFDTQMEKLRQKGNLRRDGQQYEFTSQRDRDLAMDTQQRDRRQFGYATQENDQKFGQQIERDRMQHRNTLERDYTQFGYDSLRADQQQRNTLQRDAMQGGIQRGRDTLMNEFDTQRDMRQNSFQTERDQRLNQFDVSRDERQQQFTQQNMYQRETADVAARWQEQIQQARNAGMDFSELQKAEMKELDRTFRKNVLNGPYDEGIKQRAMLEHQKKLSAIIPDEKIQDPQEGLNQSIQFHEPTNSWYLQSKDARGFPVFEPLGNGRDAGQAQQLQMQQQEKEQQQAQKQAEAIRKAEFDRDKEFQEIVRGYQSETDDLGNPTYTRQQAIEAAIADYEPREKLWQQHYGLPPHYAYQQKAENEARRDPPPVNRNPYRQNPQLQSSGFRPTTGPQRPTVVSTTNLDEQVRKTADSGDKEAADALRVFQLITQKTGGKPVVPGTQDAADLIEAMRVLRKKGIAIQGQERPKVNTTPPYGGDFFQF